MNRRTAESSNARWRMEKDPTVVKYENPSNERYTKIYKKCSARHSGAKLYAVLPDSKNFKAGILKKLKALSLRYKTVCHKWK